MTIHFICRGNAFRSLIAEAHLMSLCINNLDVLSSGVVADEFRAANQNYFKRTGILLQRHGIGQHLKQRPEQLTQDRLQNNDIVICMNQRVYDECVQRFRLPSHTQIWDIDDIGERKYILKTGESRDKSEELIYPIITNKVDELARSLEMHE